MVLSFDAGRLPGLSSNELARHEKDRNMSNPDEHLSRDDERSLSRKQFCVAENISLSTYHKMRRAGHGPRETHFPRMALVRISAEDRRTWHADIKKWNKTEAADQENQRRAAQTRAAGKKAAESPKHVSKRKKGKSKSAKG
jgi:hypothetical protein